MSEAERREGMRRIKYAFVGTVGASGALVALQAEASLAVIALAAVGGAVAGAVLWWYLVRTFRSATDDAGRRR